MPFCPVCGIFYYKSLTDSRASSHQRTAAYFLVVFSQELQCIISFGNQLKARLNKQPLRPIIYSGDSRSSNGGCLRIRAQSFTARLIVILILCCQETYIQLPPVALRYGRYFLCLYIWTTHTCTRHTLQGGNIRPCTSNSIVFTVYHHFEFRIVYVFVCIRHEKNHSLLEKYFQEDLWKCQE